MGYIITIWEKEKKSPSFVISSYFKTKEKNLLVSHIEKKKYFSMVSHKYASELTDWTAYLLAFFHDCYLMFTKQRKNWNGLNFFENERKTIRLLCKYIRSTLLLLQHYYSSKLLLFIHWSHFKKLPLTALYLFVNFYSETEPTDFLYNIN